MEKPDPIQLRILLGQSLASALKSSATTIVDVDAMRPNLPSIYLSFLPADKNALALLEELSSDPSIHTDDFPPQRRLRNPDDIIVASMQAAIRDGEKNKVMRKLKRVFQIKDILLGRLRKPESDEAIIFAFHRFGNERPFSKTESRLLHIALEELKIAGTPIGLLEPKFSQLSVLTARQREIVIRLLNRNSPRSIAHDLGISLNTVREYIQDSYRRLAISNRSELDSRFGLLQPEI